MSTARLTGRIPVKSVIGPACLPDHALICNKQGRDGSGKANIIIRNDCEVYGVLYELHQHHFATLDRIEGGYRRMTLTVYPTASEKIGAQTYIAYQLTTDPVPFDWYRDLMITGAREHGLPETYIHFLQALPVRKAD